MQYTQYLSQSLKVFTVCFIIGIIIDKIFYNIKLQYTNLHPLFLAFTQLFVIINITYLLHHYKLFSQYFETYSPHIIFSTFLFSLQSTMIDNFKTSINYILS
jgi:hypothetical protein